MRKNITHLAWDKNVLHCKNDQLQTKHEFSTLDYRGAWLTGS